MSRVLRETGETRVDITLDRVGNQIRVQTGNRLLDHMVVTLARYAGWSLAIVAEGDLAHHLVEDVAIALGEAVRRATPERAQRYGERCIPMDDALVHAVLDLGGRAYYEGRLPSSLYEHWLRSFAMHAGATLHVRVLRGRDRHHVVEAAFKALGLALAQAMADGGSVFSTKGAVLLEATD